MEYLDIVADDNHRATTTVAHLDIFSCDPMVLPGRTGDISMVTL